MIERKDKMKLLKKIAVGVISLMLLSSMLIADTTITVKNESGQEVIIKGEFSGPKTKVAIFGGMPNSKEVSNEFQDEFEEITLNLLSSNWLDSKEFKVRAVLDRNKEWQFADSSGFTHVQRGDDLTITIIDSLRTEDV
jgi:hypothetical protein